jgi:hypothetical protein
LTIIGKSAQVKPASGGVNKAHAVLVLLDILTDAQEVGRVIGAKHGRVDESALGQHRTHFAGDNLALGALFLISCLQLFRFLTKGNRKPLRRKGGGNNKSSKPNLHLFHATDFVSLLDQNRGVLVVTSLGETCTNKEAREKSE